MHKQLRTPKLVLLPRGLISSYCMLIVKYSKIITTTRIIEPCIMLKDELSVLKKGELHLESQDIYRSIDTQRAAHAL